MIQVFRRRCPILRSILVLATMTMASVPPPASARQVLLVASYGANTIGEYNATTGATIDPAFVTGQGLNGPWALTADRNSHVFVANYFTNTVGEYDATTGAAINAALITVSPTANGLVGLAVDGSNHVFVRGGNNTTRPPISEYDATTGASINSTFAQPFSYSGPLAVDGQNNLFAVNKQEFPDPAGVSKYNATTGATINTRFIPINSELNGPLAMLLDGNNHLFVANYSNNTVGEYDATTGATVNATFINGQGLNEPLGLAFDGNNHLFVANEGSSTVGEYDATTGATINAAFIDGQGLYRPSGLIFIAPVPEPSSLLLVAGAAGIGGGLRRRRRENVL